MTNFLHSNSAIILLRPMDFLTGLSIYNRPWLIEPTVAANLYEHWLAVRSEEGAFKPESVLMNHIGASAQVAIAPTNTYAIADFAGFDGATVAVIPVMGVLMKHDYCGKPGMSTLAALTQMAANTSSVQRIVLAIDSPGGSVDGVEVLANTIKNSGKKTTALVSGMACSGGLWIMAACDESYATSSTDMFGSVGVMIQLWDDTEAMAKNGTVLRKFVSSGSPDKNKAIDAAIKGDGKTLIADHLDPIHDIFKAAVREKRPNVKDEALTGKSYHTAEAQTMGFISGISSLSEIVTKTNSTNLPIKQHNMILAEFKAQHPDTFAAAQTEILATERDRTGAWLAFQAVDPKAVAEGIAAGNNISQTQMAAFTIKMAAQKDQAAVTEDGAANEGITTPETKPEAADEAKASAAFAKEVTDMTRNLVQLPAKA